MKNKRTAYITQTAVMLALLIGVQFATRSFGQFITGSLVNLVLLVSVFLIGLRSGLTVASISPFLAFLVGVGPAFIQIVPFIAIGNVILVFLAWLIRKYIVMSNIKDAFFTAAGLLIASVMKTVFLWGVLVMIALPLISGISEKQVAAISAAFSWPQLITALIGSTMAFILIPILKKAIKN